MSRMGCGLARASTILALQLRFNGLKGRRPSSRDTTLVNTVGCWSIVHKFRCSSFPNSVASFNAAARACQLDMRFVLDETVSTAEVGAILHEVTYARIADRGIAYDEILRHRIERACREHELTFAARLQDTIELQERLRNCSSGPPAPETQ